MNLKTLPIILTFTFLPVLGLFVLSQHPRVTRLFQPVFYFPRVLNVSKCDILLGFIHFCITFNDFYNGVSNNKEVSIRHAMKAIKSSCKIVIETPAYTYTYIKYNQSMIK